jgi:hypothetical protein
LQNLILGFVGGAGAYTIYGAETKGLKAIAMVVLAGLTIGLVSWAWRSLGKERRHVLSTSKEEAKNLVRGKLADAFRTLRNEARTIFLQDITDAGSRFKRDVLQPALLEQQARQTREKEEQTQTLERELSRVDSRVKVLEKQIQPGGALKKWITDADRLLLEAREQLTSK